MSSYITAADYNTKIWKQWACSASFHQTWLWIPSHCQLQFLWTGCSWLDLYSPRGRDLGITQNDKQLCHVTHPTEYLVCLRNMYIVFCGTGPWTEFAASKPRSCGQTTERSLSALPWVTWAARPCVTQGNGEVRTDDESAARRLNDSKSIVRGIRPLAFYSSFHHPSTSSIIMAQPDHWRYISVEPWHMPG